MKKELQNEYDIVPLDCAGKGRRINEPFYKDIDEAVSDLLSIIINEIKDERYSIFGYSLGSLLTYEIACKLKQLSYKMPECVFLSAMKPPDKIKDLEKKHLLSDKEFIKAIVSMGGVNKDYFDDKRYYDFCLPLLRSDYNLIGNYQYKKRNFKLDTKGIILYSSEENINDDIFRWNNYFDKQCKFYEFDNGHFFINYHLDKIVKIIRMNWIEKNNLEGDD